LTLAPSLLALAAAQSYRLSGDALVLSRAPAGIIALGGSGRPVSWASAEALIWAGAGDERRFDALVALVRVAHPSGYAELSLGRSIASGSALPPIHLDGAQAVLRAPFGTSVEAFAGIPVARELVGRGGDWAAGGRAGQSILGYGAIGLSFGERRDAGELADREIGADVSFHFGEIVELSARGAYDLVSPGISEANAVVGFHLGIVSAAAYGSHRSPARLIPATSIFSVLGDAPASRAGLEIEVRVAPRLDVSAAAGLRESGGFGEELRTRATLRLDDRGAGAIALEVRRDGTPSAEWSGVRGILRVPLPYRLIASAELEAVFPDRSDRGRVWPWGLVALGFEIIDGLEVSAAFEASASPEHVYAFDGLFSASHRWEAP
jgi:hypothetical protein